MDGITHTIIAMVSLIVSYYAGHYFGHRKGALVGVATMIEWIQKKVGMAQWNRWEKEIVDDMVNKHNSGH